MKKVPLYIDLVFCFLLLPLMIFIFPIERWLDNRPEFLYLLVCWLYLVYIINRSMTVPMLFRKRRHIVYAVAIFIVSTAVTFYITRIDVSSPMYHLTVHHYPRNMAKLRLHQQAVWLLYLIVATFSFAVGMLTELNNQRGKRLAVEYERDKAELALYRTQINPHFLFNTLNTLYGLIITQSEKAIPAFERFIDLTKYLYNNANKDFIQLGEEVDYICQYVQLQALRSNNYADITFKPTLSNPKMPIPPMLLINSWKMRSNTDYLPTSLASYTSVFSNKTAIYFSR